MKRALGIFSILFVLAFGAFTQSATNHTPDQLSKKQLDTLIATAQTPAEHRRIAEYFEAKALDYQGQAQDHEKMLASYKTNPGLMANNKNYGYTVNHCEYFVQAFKDLAAKSHELAQFHEQMASDAERK